MKEYRLLKHYPSLSKDWKDQEPLIVVERRLGYELHPSLKGTVELGFLHFGEVENNEYWEEIKPKEKDYEILTFEYRNTSLVNGVAYITLRENGKYLNSTSPDSIGGHSLEYILKATHWKIHSVKRLSDGKVFKKGGLVKYRCSTLKPFTIEEFKIDEAGDMRVFHGNKENPSEYVDVMLSSIHKATLPLFTTKDGWDIYEGDEHFSVPFDLSVILSMRANCFITTAYKAFKSEEAAQDYIDTYKPMYSLDTMVKVVNLWSRSGVDKSKIKQVADKLLE